MWADDPEKNKSWLGPWSGLVHCDRCHALMKGTVCPQCGRDFTTDTEMVIKAIDGEAYEVPQLIFQGALSWTTHSLLALMKREWERPLLKMDQGLAAGRPPSQRMLLVVLFWTLFEHHMDRFYDAALAALPRPIHADLMRRYATIGSRMDRLYKLVFETTLEMDLRQLGHKEVYDLLMKVQKRRNEFIHGDSEAIDDALVLETVKVLPAVQEAWLALYNHRCTGNPAAPRVWESDREKLPRS
jgi:RNA polymerase subunit RPABC4/transcription elongation factor Spt4